jgi:hypothetical protein
MEQQLNPNKFAIIWSKLQPAFVRVINTIIYGIMNLIKLVFRSIMDQFKGQM